MIKIDDFATYRNMNDETKEKYAKLLLSKCASELQSFFPANKD